MTSPVRPARALLLTLASLALACSGDDGSATDASATANETTTGTAGESTTTSAGESEGTTTGDTDTEGSESDSDTGVMNAFPVGGCGLEEYPLVDAAEMGRIVEWVPDLMFSAGDIDTLLAAQGLGALSPVASGAQLYKIRYTTQDRGALVEATGFIAVPTDLTGELPVAMWTHGTTGFSDKCGPTASAEGGFAPLLMAALGVIAVAPDYLGMNGWGAPSGMLHPYIVPEPTAIASLDSLRALQRFADGEGPADLKVMPTLQTILWGASEGGFAALWADRYAPHYAPEFEIAGVVASIPPTDAIGLVKYAMSGVNPATALLAPALIANARWYEIENPLSEMLASPLDTQLEPAILSECDPSLFDGINSVDQVYTQFARDSFANDDLEALGPWGCMLQRATLHAAEIEYKEVHPVLIQLGADDDLVHPAPVRADIPVLCGQGYTIQHVECAGLGHSDSAFASLNFQKNWALARLAGEPLDEVCVVNEPVDCSQL